MDEFGVPHNVDFKMTNRRAKINLIYVAIGFLLNMSGYYSLEALQSSLNNNAGMHSLSALYSSIVISSFFLPPLIMDTFLCRRAMAFGTITYTFYTAANFYPQPYTLIPAAILLGAGSSILWSSSRVYISNLACIYARNTRKNKEKITAYFFGVFFMIFSLSMLVGNIMSSVVFRMKKNVTVKSMELNETSNCTESQGRTSSTALTGLPLAQKRCGLHNCNESTDTYVNKNISEETKTFVDPVLLYILFSIYIIINLMAVAIFLCFMDEVPNEISRDDVQLQENRLISSTEGCINETKFTPSISTTKTGEINSNIQSESHHTSRSLQNFIFRKVLETGKFMIFNNNLKLLIPLTLHVGHLQSFAYGRFTKYWITCHLGIEYVGYIMAAYGFWAAIGGILVGRMATIISRKVIISAAVLLEGTMIACLLIWEPERFSSIWIFIAICSCSGLLFSVHKTMLTTIYSLFFHNERKAAGAALSFWDNLGTAIAYALSPVLCNIPSLYTLAGILVISTALYLVAEHIYASKKTIEK